VNSEYGTIIADKTDGEVPAKWMYNEMASPGVIWYWVNENDCYSDYKKSECPCVFFLNLLRYDVKK